MRYCTRGRFGAATGTLIDKGVDQVEIKVKRIHDKYNSLFQEDDTSFIIQGKRDLSNFLGEGYGSDGESSGADDSDVFILRKSIAFA